MGKYGTQSVFDRLAAEYLAAAGDTQDAQATVNALRREHEFELNSYYGNDPTKNLKHALKNDVRGLAK
ncbi:hypothetical protein [Lysinibacillus sp. 54212]|uniref:hypothetical protein n=1 Tax=Lysinibacillus sp. 54212 TaxID=3119829 RepID=UPI002FC71B0C